MSEPFRFKHFQVNNERSALKVGTDAVLLGAAMSLPDRRPLRLLDIGTGTGVIALMAAQRLGDGFHIDAIDIDAASAEEAAGNFEGSPWAGKLDAVNVPLQDFRPSGSYDLIFSNPPFYENSLENPDAREAAARHTGSLSYRDICSFAAENLTPDGTVSLILPAQMELPMMRTAASFGLFPFRIMRVRTTTRKPFSRVVVELGRSRTPVPSIGEIVLQDGPLRSEAYSALTEDFYL